MRIYTGTGDDGTTGLFGGGRVAKDSLRVEAYGTVDELNSLLGVAAASLGTERGAAELRSLLHRLQSELFDLGAELATLPETLDRAAGQRVPRVSASRVRALEEAIDSHWEGLPPLRTFILPGGTASAAFLHLARTVARRAERCTIALSHEEEVGPLAIVYLNRLSDLLFALARAANAGAGVDDIPWQPAAGTPDEGRG